MAGRRRAAAPLVIAPEVSRALESGGAVVALESAVITHGLPQPINFELACGMEAVVHEEGATPATIAVLDGRIIIGVTRADLQRLAGCVNCVKLGARDLAAAVVRKQSAGMTVGATMFVASRVGVSVMATGGIGGVHRENPYDISADMHELARTAMIVVCSGAKSILDLPATLEVLESASVPVASYQVDEFPAFYSRGSGLRTGLRFDTPSEVAEYWDARTRLEAAGALVLANPVPEADAIPEEEIAPMLGQASEEARNQKLAGKVLTPFLLQRVSQLSGGRTIKANLALLLNNARLAARIGLALSRSTTRREHQA